MGLFQRRISNLLDCSVLGSMATPRMWNFCDGLFVSFFFSLPFFFWLFVVSLVYVLYTLSFGQYTTLYRSKKKKNLNVILFLPFLVFLGTNFQAEDRIFSRVYYNLGMRFLEVLKTRVLQVWIMAETKIYF